MRSAVFHQSQSFVNVIRVDMGAVKMIGDKAWFPFLPKVFHKIGQRAAKWWGNLGWRKTHHMEDEMAIIYVLVA